VSLTPLNSFSAVLLTPEINFRLFGYLYRQESLIAGDVDTAENLSPVSLTRLINIHSWLSRRIYEKSRNDPNGLLRGPGDTDSWKKKLRSKISCQTPFKQDRLRKKIFFSWKALETIQNHVWTRWMWLWLLIQAFPWIMSSFWQCANGKLKITGWDKKLNFLGSRKHRLIN
jgi:hypothetical protein